MTSELVRGLSLFFLSAWLIAYASVFETVYRGGDAAGAVDELGAAEVIDGNHWSVAKESSELYHFTDFLSPGGDQADGGGLLVYHADGSLVRDDTGDR